MTVTLTRAMRVDGLRQLKKLATMRHVQLTALGLFEARGFDAVTIEEVARKALVSAPTIYRHFRTKEALVIWDEYDPVLLRSLAQHLRTGALGDGIRNGIVRPLDRIYSAEAPRILRRVRLVQKHPGLLAAAASSLRGLRSEMARTFIELGVCRDPLEADVIAAATTTALEVAIGHWARAGGKWPLRRFIQRSLRQLRRFAETTRGPADEKKTRARR